jgi:probable rRNA maturation factor
MVAGLDPELTITRRSRSTAIDHGRFLGAVRGAFPECLRLARLHGAPLASLPGVSITVMGARAMAAVHRDFLDVLGTTDVITFPYGEILVCAPVAAARACEFGHSATRELVLYAIHGLLHLSGFDDREDADAARMKAAQERILERVYPWSGG